MNKIPFILILVFCAHAQLFSQGTIRGKLIDSASGSPVGLATITIFKSSDTSLITYRLSNPEGEFRVSGIPLRTDCKIIVSFSGYAVFRRELSLTTEALLELGTISLMPDIKSLDEVLVVAERPPVTVRNDTIEFNASSFKTLPTALVEDLLRKLPGVMVDRQGNIFANGRTVNRILVDGKSFFGDDPKMATRNLPANVIDKVQLADDKEEAERTANGDLTNIGQVINLTLKKGIRKGWFGKVYAGKGTNDRYELGGIANIYKDTLQLSVLAFNNNVNRSGFSFKEVQDLGGFSRSGVSTTTINTKAGIEGFAINGLSFGGTDEGISKATGAGFNLNHAPNKKKSFFFQYLAGNNKTYLEQVNNSEQFINDTTINSRTQNSNNRVRMSHYFGAGANLKPDSLTDIGFRSGFTYIHLNDNIAARLEASNTKSGSLSRGIGNQLNNSLSKEYMHNLYLTSRSGVKKGRSLIISNFLVSRNSMQRYITELENEYFYPSYENQSFHQLRTMDIPAFITHAAVNFTEPLSKKWTFRFNNRYEYINEGQGINIYDKDSLQYDIFKHAESNGYNRTQSRFNSNLSLAVKIKQITVSAAINGLWQLTTNDFKRSSKPVQTYLFDILPAVSLMYKQLSIQYSQTVSVPAIGYMIPVPDSTNPFFIRFGNQNLRPVKRRSVEIRNFISLRQRGITYNYSLNASFLNDDVITSRTIAANGVQSIVPVNANGTFLFSGGLGFGKEFKNTQKFVFFFRFQSNMNFEKRKLMVNEKVSTANTIQFGPGLNIGLNQNDVIELSVQYGPRISSTSYTDRFHRAVKAITHIGEGELIIRWPQKFVWETNLAYRFNNQTASGMPKDNLFWNAAVTFMMLKDNKGLLKLSAFDLLNRNNGFMRYTSQNQIVDQATNVIKQYAEISFTYNIRNMSASKVGGRDRLLKF